MKSFTVVIVVVCLSLSHSQLDSFFDIHNLMFESPDDGTDSKEELAKTCCHPDSLVGKTYTFRPNSTTVTVSRFYHDAVNSRLAVLSTDSSNSATEKRTVVTCFNDNTCVVSTIDDLDKECSQRKFPGTNLDAFWTRCLPIGASMAGNMEMGLSTTGQPSLNVQLWEYTWGKTRMKRLVTGQGCVPVADFERVIYMNGVARSGYQTKYYVDVKTKIPDKKVFAIPSFCTKV